MSPQNDSSTLRWKGEQRRVGLTGGIASGKSRVGKFLKEEKKLVIIDADLIAHEVLKPGTDTTQVVLRRYGSAIEQKSGRNPPRIDRKELSKIIFSNSKERHWLESLTHPEIKEKIYQELVRKKKYPIIVLILPLLFEAKLEELCSEIWLVNCHPGQQLERLIQREKISSKEASKQINSQIPLEKKCQMADFILDNSGEDKVWIKQINKIL